MAGGGLCLLSQGGAPPHTPPRRSTQGLEAALAGGGLCRVGCGLSPAGACSDPARGAGAASGVCRPAGAGPPPMPRMDSGFRRNDGKGCAGALGAWARRFTGPGVGGAIRRRRSPALGAWGRSPHMKEVRGRVGGPEPRSALIRDGGVGGAAPRRGRAGCARSPSPPPSPARGEGAGPASGVAGCARSPSPPLSRKGRGGRPRKHVAPSRAPGGGVGAQPPHERKSEGGWVGQSRAARSSGMGVWGAQPPAGQRAVGY